MKHKNGQHHSTQAVVIQGMKDPFHGRIDFVLLTSYT